MILRKLPFILAGILAVFTLSVNSGDADTNDWIPIAQPCKDCKEVDKDEVPAVQKKAQGRVLNLADPPEANFFPEETKPQRNNYQQFLRETSNPFQNQKRPPIRHKQNPHPYRFDPSPHPGHQGRQQRPQPKPEHYYLQPQFLPQFFPAQQGYRTIPEEYLAQQALLQQRFPQNYPDIPDLPPIRLNASVVSIQALNNELLEKRKPVKQMDVTSTTPKQEKENIQLLYVPLETLNQNQPRPDLPRLHAYQQAPIQEIHQQFARPSAHKSNPKIHEIENDFIKQALEAHRLQQQFQESTQPYALPVIETTTPPTTTTTVATTRATTKKRKPHQPPLAVYMGGDQNADVSDVLSILKDATSIDVQDSVGPGSPKIFVGPSTLDTPNGYAKFELPYLSSIENNRVERKVEQLPFFVAPLSYKTPVGYSKIPLPSPHVGSVVVSTKQKPRGEEVEDVIAKQVYTQQNHIRGQIEQYTVKPIPSTTVKYSKPIPVINQYELDQINSFIPQYKQVQQAPEKYSFESFQQQFPQEYNRFISKEQLRRPQQPQSGDYELKSPQPTQMYKFQTEKSTQQSDKLVDDFSQSQYATNEKINSKEKVESDEDTQTSQPSKPLTSQEQFIEEVKPEDKNTFDSIQQTRNTHPNIRLSSTASPHNQYLKETVSQDNYSFEDIAQPKPNYIRTRPSSTSAPREQYLRDSYNTQAHARPTRRRNRPPITTPTPREQYLKETVSEELPAVSRQRQPSPAPIRQQAHSYDNVNVDTKYSFDSKESVSEERPTHTRQRQTSPAPIRQQAHSYDDVNVDTKYSFDSNAPEHHSKESVSEERPTHTRQRQTSPSPIRQQPHSYDHDNIGTFVSNAPEQYSKESVSEERPTHTRQRQTSPAPIRQQAHSYDDVNVDTKYSFDSNAPEHHSKESVSEERPTHTRQRQTSPSPIRQQPHSYDHDNIGTFDSNAPEQYLKESVSEERPTHTRQRQTSPAPTRQQSHSYDPFESNTHIRPADPSRSSTPSPEDHYVNIDAAKVEQTFYSPKPTRITLSSTPKEPISEHSLYSPRPTQNTYTDFDSKDSKHSLDLPNPSKKTFTEFSEEYVDRINKQIPVTEEEDKFIPKQEPVYNPTDHPLYQNKHILNQHVLDSKILGQPPQRNVNYIQENYNPRPNNLKHEDEPLIHRQQYYTHEDTSDSHEVKTQNANVEIYNLPQEVSPTRQVLPNLINNLEDQSIRQLLNPGLVPTSSRLPEVNNYNSGAVSSTETTTPATTTTTPTPTSTYPSTHYPVVETTTKRTRGRQRGNRYSTTTQSSVYSTRRTSQRGRRPLPPRTRYQDEGASTTDYPSRSTTDPTKRIVTSRSRTRARGRPAQSESPVLDRVSSTEKHYYNDIQEHSTARIVENEQSTPRLQQFDVSEKYQRPSEIPPSSVTPKVVNVEITRPENEPIIIQQINHLPVRNIEDRYEPITTSKPSRGRSRIRGRTRATTTTTKPIPSTARRHETSNDSEEFYGFFREPNFKKSQSIPVTEAPQRPLYSSTYISSTFRPGIEYADEPYIQTSSLRYQTESDEPPIQFVGEIRPKYQSSSTSQYFEATQPSPAVEVLYQSKPQETENDQVKIRGRIRVPGRRVTTDEPVDRGNDLSVKEDTSARTPQRGRTRGKSHFKPKPKPKDSAEDEDVEGGNYPPQFRTPQASFQITIDPTFDDQEPYPSIYRPTYVAKEGNGKDSAEIEESLTYQSFNDIKKEVKINISTNNEETPSESTNNTDIHPPNGDYEQVERETERTIDDAEATTILPYDGSTKGRRRGVWKLVKRPIDVLEGAESQNIGTVSINSFDNFPSKMHIIDASKEVEDDPTTIPSTEEIPTTIGSTTTESSIFNSLYEMFGLTGNEAVLSDEPVEATTESRNQEVSTIPIDETTLGEEYFQDNKNVADEPPVTTGKQVEDVEENSSTTFPPMTYVTPMSLETWNLGVVKTLTSTEISHETEICYKGRCIKSKDMT